MSLQLGDNYVSKCSSDTQNIYHHAWKTVKTTLKCIVGLQSRGKVMKRRKTMGHKDKDKDKCISGETSYLDKNMNIYEHSSPRE